MKDFAESVSTRERLNVQIAEMHNRKLEIENALDLTNAELGRLKTERDQIEQKIAPTLERLA